MNDININVAAGSSVTLKTAGKYCDKNIVVIASGGDGSIKLQYNKTVTPTKSQQTVSPDSGYGGLGNVIVEKIPDSYIEPSGTLDITDNGEKDVTRYKKVLVNVPTGGGGSSADLDALCIISYGNDPYGYGVIFEKGMTWEQLINSSYNTGIDGEAKRFTSSNGYVKAYDLDYCQQRYISMSTYIDDDSYLIKTTDTIVATQYYNVDHQPSNSGDEGNSGGDSTPVVKTFTINGTPAGNEGYEQYHSTFEFEEGMTFGEWRNSPYNIDGYYSYENGYGWEAAICQCFGDSSEYALFDTDGNLITDNDVIIEGSGNYELVLFDNYGEEDSGGDSGEVKTFTLENFAHESADNGDNTFNFKEGMTWGQWKASTYNSWYHSNYGEFKFETYHNGTVSIDVGCNPDTPIEGVCNADGTPVKDSEVIQAITYLYVDDLDWYGCEEDSGGSGETHTAYMETCYANGVGSYTFEFTDGQTVGDIFEDVCCPACGQHLEGVTEDTVLEPDGHYYCPNY